MNSANPKLLKVSPSGIGYLMECPRCLWLHANEEIKRPRGIFPSLPDGMDNAFKIYFDVYRKKGTLPPEIDGKINGKLFNDMPRLDLWRNIDFGRGGLVSEFPELGMVLRGAIDELLVDPEGRYILFDFKTRGYPTKEDTHEHYRDQLDLYGLLFNRNGMTVAPDGYLLFFWPDGYEKNAARFTTQLIKITINPQRAYQILKRVHEIVTGPKPGSHSNCEYCIFRESNPAT